MKCTSPLYWYGCYTGTSDLIAPESYSHPAKMSVPLCFRILEHLKEMGLLNDGDTILDPMGGTGLTAICAGAKGYKAVTVELEKKFIDMCQTYVCPGVVHYSIEEKVLPAVKAGMITSATGGLEDNGELEYRTYYRKAQPERKRYKVHATSRCGKGEWHPVHRIIGNKDYAERKLYKKLDWTILKGDARRLSELLSERGLVSLTSPPYSEAQSGGGIAVKGYQGNKHSPTDLVGKRSYMPDVHGKSEGQIANLKDVPLVSITSPPYGESLKHPVGDREVEFEKLRALGYKINPNSADNKVMGDKYSDNPDNIGNLPDKPLKTVMSPPYADNQEKGGGIDWEKAGRSDRLHSSPNRHNVDGLNPDGYGTTEGQIGALPDKPLKTLMSPPHFDTMSDWDRKSRAALEGQNVTYSDEVGKASRDNIGNIHYYDGGEPISHKYSRAKEGDETYLEAMLAVYSEIAKVSNVLAIVIKNPTRAGKLRNLALDTFLLLKSCQNVLYCNCETNYLKEGIELDDNEWQIYKTLAQSGKGMLSVRVTHKQQVKDGQMPETQPEGNESHTTHRGNKSQNTGEAGIADYNTRAPPTYERRAEEALLPNTQETETNMRCLRERGYIRLSPLPQACNDATSEREVKAGITEGLPVREKDTTIHEGDKTAKVTGSEQSDVARWDEGERSAGIETQQSEVAESQDAVSSEGQLRVSEVWERGIHGSPQTRQDLGREDTRIQSRRPDDAVSSLPYENGRAAEVCRVCGKPKIESQNRSIWQVVCTHRALLFEELEQMALSGETKKLARGRLSFFKRLSYQKGQPVARWEDIIIATK